MSETCEVPLFNSSDKEVKEILSKYKTIAVVGISPKEDRPSFRVASYLKSKGYKIIPVNPGHEEVLGEKCYPSLKEVPEKVEIVDIFRKAEAVEEVIKQAIEIGAKVAWMQLGIVNNKAAKLAKDAGMQVVMDKCMLVEHGKLF